jgi:hypothetical protein
MKPIDEGLSPSVIDPAITEVCAIKPAAEAIATTAAADAIRPRDQAWEAASRSCSP